MDNVTDQEKQAIHDEMNKVMFKDEKNILDMSTKTGKVLVYIIVLFCICVGLFFLIESVLLCVSLFITLLSLFSIKL